MQVRTFTLNIAIYYSFLQLTSNVPLEIGKCTPGWKPLDNNAVNPCAARVLFLRKVNDFPYVLLKMRGVVFVDQEILECLEELSVAIAWPRFLNH